MAIDWLKYLNQGATRNQALDPKLVSALSFLPDMGISMGVFSGGQPAEGPKRTGSHRHDHGGAADVFFYKDGRQLNWANPQDLPVFQEIVGRARANGVTGFGAGEGYMRPGSMHIGFGAPAVWGAGGKGANAPEWLTKAFSGVTSAPLPPAVSPEAADFVRSNPQPGGYGQRVDGAVFGSEPPAPGLPASPAPQGGILADNSLPVDVARYAASEDQKSPLQMLGSALQELGRNQPSAPRPAAFPGGPTQAQSQGLLELLGSPTMGDLLMKRRTQGILS